MGELYDSTSWYIKDESDFGKISKSLDKVIQDAAEENENMKKESKNICNIISRPVYSIRLENMPIHKRIKMKKHRSKKWRNGKKK